MPRLIDDLRASGKLAMPWWVRRDKIAEWDRYAVRVMRDFVMQPDLPVISADNVATYYFEATDQEMWNIRDDFPCLAPPYPVFWIEHKLPKVINSKENGVTDVTQWTPNGRTGMLFCAADIEQCKFEGEPPQGTKWIYWCEYFTDYGQTIREGYEGPHGSVFFAIDKEGRALAPPWMQSWARKEDEHMMKHVMAWYNSGLLTISFMHCKNVVMVDHKVDAPLAKKWAAKHDGRRPVEYKTLVIEPLKQILRTHGGHGRGNSLQQALRICRGKFWDYREGPGLFGKYNQLVWHPMTVRGSKGGKPHAPNVEVKI